MIKFYRDSLLRYSWEYKNSLELLRLITSCSAMHGHFCYAGAHCMHFSICFLLNDFDLSTEHISTLSFLQKLVTAEYPQLFL